MVEVTLTKQELISMLDAQIRHNARWSVKRSTTRDDLHTFGASWDFDEKAHLTNVAQDVFDQIVTEYKYNELLLKATRALGDAWNTGYVIRVIKAALKKGTLKYEQTGDEIADQVMEEMTFSRAKLGSGGRFKACVAKMRQKGKQDPEGLCAFIGRKKYGVKRFAKLGAAGK